MPDLTGEISNGDDIDPYLSNLGAGERLTIPEGRYHQNGQHSWNNENGDIEIVGEGAGVELTAPDGHNRKWECKQHSGTFEVRNITFSGVAATGNGNGEFGGFAANGDGEIRWINVHWPDGTAEGSDGHCIYVPDYHAGDFYMDSCSIERWADNGLYGSAPGGGGAGGTVRAENCYFRNNNVANVRLGSSGSYVKDSTLIQDGGAVHHDKDPGVNASNLKMRQNGHIEAVNCDMVHENTRRWSIVVHDDVSSGSVTLDNCRIYHTSNNDVVNGNPNIEWRGSGNHFTGDPDSTIPREVFECVGDGCTLPAPKTDGGTDPSECSGDGDCPDGYQCISGECVRTTTAGPSEDTAIDIAQLGASAALLAYAVDKRFDGDYPDISFDNWSDVDIDVDLNEETQ